MATVLTEGPAVDREGIPHYRMYIGGEWVDTDERYALISPATEEVFATAAKGDTGHADAAVAAAKQAFEEGTWRNTPPLERAEGRAPPPDDLRQRLVGGPVRHVVPT
ncbi:aldehyde dehydrogenase family protein, partial [Streptomyces roseolus]|uniref:aldehyde dehydrogenase family protein n=1 Tax=Streptomyces roseolus TaxID=67358 RepID=UPI00364A67A5